MNGGKKHTSLLDRYMIQINVVYRMDLKGKVAD